MQRLIFKGKRKKTPKVYEICQLLKLFSGYGTSMCCSRIRVTLNGVVKDKQGQYGIAGTYQKAIGLINNRSYWNHIDGDVDMYSVLSTLLHEQDRRRKIGVRHAGAPEA